MRKRVKREEVGNEDAHGFQMFYTTEKGLTVYTGRNHTTSIPESVDKQQSCLGFPTKLSRGGGERGLF